MAGKTSTFIFHHDRCNPGDWTAKDIFAFRDFVATGSLQYAAHIARLGVELILSEELVPKGGELEMIGHADQREPMVAYDDISEAVDMAGDGDITGLYPIYRGKLRYAVRIHMGDEDGNYDGTEFEFKDSEAEAQAYLASLYEHEPTAESTP